MPWTQDDLDALEADIAANSGQKSVTFGDRTVVFSSLEEKLRLRALMRADLAVAGTVERFRGRYAYQSGRGL